MSFHVLFIFSFHSRGEQSVSFPVLLLSLVTNPPRPPNFQVKPRRAVCTRHHEVIHIPPPIPEERRLFVGAEYAESESREHSATISSGLASRINAVAGPEVAGRTPTLEYGLAQLNRRGGRGSW